MNLKVDLSSVTKQFESLMSRSRFVDGWLNRVAYPQLLNVQRERWQTEGGSQGSQWKPISEKTKQSKLKRFRDYPGGGRKSLIATGRLAYSMTLTKSLRSDKASDSDHYKLVSGQKLAMGSFVPYAKYQEEKGRDLTSLSEDTQEKLVKSLKDYIVNGTLGPIR